MNKIKVSKKDMRENYRIVSAGYCDMQNLLHFKYPVAYSSGQYGWCCDYYNINNVVISTGYSPLSNKNMYCDYESIRKYEKMARDILSNNSIKWEDKEKEIENILIQFIEESKIK